MYVNAMSVYYIGRRLHLARVPILPRVCETLGYLAFNCSLPVEAEIGPGCKCDHRGVAVVVHKTARIGARCHFGPHVVVGVRRGGNDGAPTIGNDVMLGAGAKVLGPIAIGNRASIGAGAVVMQDVPERCVAVGVPARVIHHDPGSGERLQNGIGKTE